MYDIYSILHISWKGGRVVECTGLENRSTRKGTVGSNPTPSAKNNIGSLPYTKCPYNIKKARQGRAC